MKAITRTRVLAEKALALEERALAHEAAGNDAAAVACRDQSGAFDADARRAAALSGDLDLWDQD